MQPLGSVSLAVQLYLIIPILVRSIYCLLTSGVICPQIQLHAHYRYRCEKTHFFCRIKSGNPGYLVAFNTADEEVTVSFSKLKHVPEELNVLIKSSNFDSTGIKAKLVS
jgi:hypothetical protein